MDRRRNILLVIFLILIFNCGGKSLSIEPLTLTTNSENSDNNNIVTDVIGNLLVYGDNNNTDDMIGNLVNGDNNNDNQQSGNAGFDLPKVLPFLRAITNICSNNTNSINETSNTNDKDNGIIGDIDTNNFISFITVYIIQTDKTMKPALCQLQKYLAIIQKLVPT